jgi:hypothetical protein
MLLSQMLSHAFENQIDQHQDHGIYNIHVSKSSCDVATNLLSLFLISSSLWVFRKVHTFELFGDSFSDI